jgi:AraC-like DNA-binding protein
MTERQQAFRAFLDELIKKEGTAQKLAAAVGMSPTAILRAAHEQFTLNVENCLRVAAHAGVEPSKVLILAGKDPIAALLEDLYGQSRPAISDLDRQLLALTTGVKRLIVRLIHELKHDDKEHEHKHDKRRLA